MNISLRHLKAFVAVARTGSFTAAAASLNLSQSSLTKTIRELEHEIHLQLFERTTRQTAMTTAGQTFLPSAIRLLNDFDLAMADLQAQARGSSGTVRIAAGLAFSSTVLPRVVRELQLHHPGISLTLTDDTSGGVIRRIASGDVDIGVGSYVGAAQDILEIRHLLRARLGLLFPPGYAHIPSIVSPAHLDTYPIIRDVEDSSIATVLRKHAPAVWSSLSDRIVATNLDLQLSLVREGVGACALSALAASHPSAITMPFRLIEGEGFERDIYIFTRKGLPLSPAASTLISILQSVLPHIGFIEGVVLSNHVPPPR
ncbi:HTH-type transcriptional activator CmpR [Paraburkholderia aspalathi]|uniref:LysR family transcriptional regulator n=1 Tax=Paraburkholderia aspalathi TaxID=1324617 RepID=UPI001B2F06BF|nr:LysR family transcriptional regulator [Paraburkholderia aspalathi]CAE6813213.1 HTH-type transcriptional activator CmpR [Paraburkholderia aspalathi]